VILLIASPSENRSETDSRPKGSGPADNRCRRRRQ